MTTLAFGPGAPLALDSGVPTFAREYRRMVEALARTAPCEAKLDSVRYLPAARARAARVWRGRAVSEYESTSAFAELAVQVMEANAPVDTTATILRMASDELRHAELCFEVVRALGEAGAPAAPASFTRQARHPGCSAAERALRNVVYGCCLSETVNAARFVDALDQGGDPFVNEVNRRLLADEALHAKFGFLYLELWRPYLTEHAEARAALAGFLPRAFAAIERELAAPRPGFQEPTADEIALGVPTTESLRATFYTTVEQAIVPALDGFGLEASAAWRARAAAASD